MVIDATIDGGRQPGFTGVNTVPEDDGVLHENERISFHPKI